MDRSLFFNTGLPRPCMDMHKNFSGLLGTHKAVPKMALIRVETLDCAKTFWSSLPTRLPQDSFFLSRIVFFFHVKRKKRFEIKKKKKKLSSLSIQRARASKNG